jgi:hypothetical protein
MIPEKEKMKRKIAEMAREGVAICAIQIPLLGENTQMSSDITLERHLNDADLKVAHAMGIDPKAVTAMKSAHGKGGLAVVALHTGTGLDGFGYPSPFHPVKPVPPTNPGKITKDGGVPVKTIVEPEDSDDEMVRDPAGLLVRPMRVIFPVRQ